MAEHGKYGDVAVPGPLEECRGCGHTYEQHCDPGAPGRTRCLHVDFRLHGPCGLFIWHVEVLMTEAAAAAEASRTPLSCGEAEVAVALAPGFEPGKGASLLDVARSATQ